MKNNKILLAFFAAIFSVAAAQAEDLYAGINYTSLNADTGNTTVHPSVATVSFGSLITPNFALETRFGAGISSDSTTLLGQNVDIKFNNIYGIYGKGIFPVSDVVSIYGLAGYTHAQTRASIRGFSVTDSTGSGSYGFGVNIAATKTVSFNLEFAKIASDTTGLTIGVAAKF